MRVLLKKQDSFFMHMNQLLKNKKIAIQGIPGAFHEIAAKRYFGKEPIEIIPSNSFEELICLTQNNGLTDGGIMAIENSIVGNILHNYLLIRESNLSITGELFLRIKQNLLTRKGQQLSDLKEVHSHPMAIAQCFSFFKNHPKIKLIETEDTALSAKYISENQLNHVGAIASSEAAEKYNLQVIAEGIETNQQNYTRFLILNQIANKPTKGDCRKVSISFALKHEVGSLHKVLATLAAFEANLTKIQSIPIPGQNWHYLFFLDYVLKDPLDFEKSIESIKSQTEALQILGLYQTGKHYDD